MKIQNCSETGPRGRWLIVKVLAVTVMLLTLPTVFAADTSSKAESDKLERKVVDGLQKRYEKIETYKVKFHQTLSSPVFKKVIREASGVIYYSKPGKIRWEYKKPDERLYLVDGEFFWDYDPSAGQVLKVPLEDALAGDVPQGFLFGAGDIKKDFNVELIGKTTKGSTPGYRLKLEPKDKALKRAISDLELVVSPEKYRVIASSFTDAQGNINRYKFTDIKENPELKPELFAFKVPKGVKVMLPVTKSEVEQHKSKTQEKDKKKPEEKK